MSKKNTQPKYYTCITAERKWFDFNLKEVWQYRDLIWLFTKRSFILSYKQTILGPAWIILRPIFTSIIYTFVFGGIAGMSTDGLPKILFYLCSNAIWTYFASCISDNAHTFTGNAGIFGKVYFPRLTTPLSNVLSAIIRFGIQMILILAVLAYYLPKGEVHPHWEAWPLIPLSLINLGLMGMGIGILISSMTTKYRDLTVFIGFGISLWMYATPIIYTISQMNDGFLKTVLLVNPATAPIEIFRYAVLGQGTIIPAYVALSWGITILVTLLGIMVFNRVEKTFMDTV